MRLAELAKLTPTEEARACYQHLDGCAPDDYRQLAALLVDHWRRRRISTVGIGGGQGAGKSTLGRLITAAGDCLGVRIQVLSLDDFYLTKAQRRHLAAQVHPLLATRGPPGTHAIGLLRDAMAALLRPGRVEVPRFDKGVDDRLGQATLHGPMDLVVLEGWCVGALAAPRWESTAPINALEREHDADGRWRRYIDAALGGEYAALNGDFESTVFLQVPGMRAVRRWRLRQEAERPPGQRLTAARISRFVDYYERVTRRMLALSPESANAVVELDEAHRISGLRLAG